MGWSIPLGRLFGTEVRVHLTFFLLIAWYAVAVGAQHGQAEALNAIVFIVLVFACVLAHEFGHVLVARRFGIGTRNITLLPIGGVASIERMPEKPGQELLIAIAGPAVNVVIAILLFALFGAHIDPKSMPADMQAIDLVTRLAIVNVALFLFNLIPAFPMDGGRVLRAVLSFFMERGPATRLAASIGQAAAFGLGFMGLFGNPLLIFIALFVFLAASHESYAVDLDEATKGVSMRRATITSFVSLDTQATVGKAVEALLSTTQQEFPVTDGTGQLRGVLTRDGMIRALTERGPETPVIDVMDREIVTINSRAPLSEAVRAFQSGAHSIVGIVDDQQRVVGIINLENLAEYMMAETAGKAWRQTAAARA